MIVNMLVSNVFENERLIYYIQFSMDYGENFSV